MSSSPTPTAAAALSRTTSPINYLFLVEGCVCVIVAVAFLFYWNRLLGNGLSWCIRLYAWRKHNAYISVGSLQISPLAGRILFRDVHYHSSNLSLRVLHGHVTWRYWKRRVRQEGHTRTSQKLLPCRISVFAEGVELFVFNRTPAYDAIVERMKKHEAENAEDFDVQFTEGKARKRKGFTDPEDGPSSSNDRWSDEADRKAETSRTRSNVDSTNPLKRSDTLVPKATISWFREMLPIELEVLTGAIVLGNDATPMVLVIDFKEGTGTVEASPSRSPLDYYKFGVNLSFREPKILMRTNTDYTGSLLNHGKRMYDKLSEEKPDILVLPPSELSMRQMFRQLASKLSFLHTPETPSLPSLEHGPWKGLARYREDAAGGTAFGRSSHEIEYAKVTTLLDSPAVDVSFFYDEPGTVLHADPLVDTYSRAQRADQLGNGDEAPEYGIDVVVHGGSVKYGPWADRQRDALQKAFAPSIFFNTEPHSKLQPGDKRVATAMKLMIRLDEETVLRLPTREFSKDWQYDSRRGYKGKVRPYGWLDVKVGADSYITYVQSQVATVDGYDSQLNLHLDGITMVTSVNMQTFMTADVCRLSLSMPTPLKWNEERTWGFDVTMDRPEIFLLRDHVTLIADLAKDWSSGSTGDFFHFVPNHYQFKVALKNYALRMNLNDYNVVDRPTSLEDNAFAHLTGPVIGAHVTIDAGKYRAEQSTIPFNIHAHNVTLCLSVPQWDTHASFETGRTSDVGRIGSIEVVGSFLFYASPDPSHQETLTLDIKSTQIAFKCLGWVLRRLFSIKDNYFGAYTNFTTFSEFSERFAENPKLVGDRVEEKYRPGRTDSFAVNLTARILDSRMLLPETIFDCLTGVFIPVPEFQLTLRSVDQLMEMSIDLQPTYLSCFNDVALVYPGAPLPDYDVKEVIFMEGVEVKAHRLFGPQPRASTYLCLWEIRSSAIQAQVTPLMCHTLQNVGRAFGYNFTDMENAPAAKYVPPSDPDVTFFKLEIDVLDVNLVDPSATSAVVRASAPSGLQLDTSSLVTRTFASLLALSLPSLHLMILSRDVKAKIWREVGSAAVDLQLDLYKKPYDWQDHAAAQQAYVREQDGPTRRAEALYIPERSNHNVVESVVHLPQPDSRNADTEAELGSDTSSHSSMFSLTSSNVDSLRSSRKLRSFITARESHSDDSMGAESGEESDFTCPSDSTRTRGTSTADADGRFECTQGLYLSATDPRYDGIDEPEVQGLPTPSSWGVHAADASVMKFRSKRGVLVQVTLEVLDVISTILKGFTDITPSTETLLDGLLDQQVDAVAHSRAMRATVTLVDIALPLVSVKLHVASQDDKPVLSQASLDVNVKISSPCILLETGKSQEGNVRRLASQIPNCVVQLSTQENQGLAIGLTDAGKFAQVPIPSEDFLSAYVAINALQVEADSSNAAALAVDCKSIDLESVHQTFFLLLAAIEYLPPQIKTIFAAGPETRQHVLQADLVHLLHEAILKGYSTVNPGFMDVESSALHGEVDSDVRRCLGWMTLARFRQWSRASQSTSRRAQIRPAELPFGSEGMVRRLANLKEWEPIEPEDVRQQAFLQMAFPDLRIAPDPSPSTLYNTVHVRLQSLGINLHGVDVAVRSVVTTSLDVRSLTVESIYCGLDASNMLAIGAELLSIVGGTNLVPLAHTLDSMRKTGPSGAGQSAVKVRKSSTSWPVGALSLHIQRLSIEVDASGLHAATVVDHLQVAAMNRAQTSPPTSGTLSAASLSVLAEHIQLRADGDAGAEHADSTKHVVRSLIQLSVDGVNVLVDFATKRECGVVISATNVALLTKPRLQSVISYLDSWRERHLATYEKALADLSVMSGPSAAKRAEDGQKRGHGRVLNLDVRLIQATIRVRASKALWLAWGIGGSVACVKRNAAEHEIAWSYAVKLGSQGLGVVASNVPSTDSATLLKLPWVQLRGSRGRQSSRRAAKHIVCLSFGEITGTAKPAILERLLSMYEHLRHDVQAVIDLWDKASHVRKSDRGLVDKTVAPSGATFQVDVAVRGLYFALRADGVPSLLVLKAAALTGQVTNCAVERQAGLAWSAHAKDLTLALGRPTRLKARTDAPLESRHCSAYMILSVHVEELPSVQKSVCEDVSREASLNIKVTPVHSVMHVSALGELLDLVKTWSTVWTGLQARRAPELTDLRSQTSRVLKSLEPASAAPIDASWFAQRVINVHIAGIGIAIPLVEVNVVAEGTDAQLPEFSALLLAVHTISYWNKRNETARSNIQHLNLQFVTKFDQLNSEHFKSLSHQSRNKMSLPDLESQAQMSQKSGHWEVYSHSTASGFQLSLASNITDHVFALLGLYDTGKLRYALLVEQYQRDLATFYALNTATAAAPTSPTSSSATKASMKIRATFVFNSGLVSFHSPKAPETIASIEPSDLIRLPTISLCAVYSANAEEAAEDDIENTPQLSYLWVNAAVHASSNDIKPTILPFCHAIVRQVSAHFTAAADRASRVRPLTLRSTTETSDDQSSPAAAAPIPADQPRKRVKYEVSLRIEQSELRFQCLDGAKAYAALEWASGGFVLTHVGGPAGISTLAGTVSGVGVSLGHTFRSESTFLTGQGKDLTFSVATEPESLHAPLTINVVADTELLMSLNMGLYFACLGFVAVWWDTMPAVHLRRAPAEAGGSADEPSATTSSRKLSVNFLLRVRQLEFDADVAISKGSFYIQSLVARGSFGHIHKELRLSIAKIRGQAAGDVAGKLENSNFAFLSHRETYERGMQVFNPVFLDMAVHTGDTEIRLDVDHQTILRAHIANTVITLADDWSAFAPDHAGGKSLKLAFGVDAGRVDGVITLLAIPQLLRRINAIFDIMEDQRVQAVTDSPAFRARRTGKNRTASKGIAAAMLQSAKNHAEDFTPSRFKIIQAVRFDLAGLDLGVYSQDIHESDFYRFRVGRVGADQLRDVDDSGQPARHIDLMVAYVTWETSERGRPPKESDSDLPVSRWIELAASHDRREVASLPALTLTMNSTEMEHPPILEYDFDLIWGETDGDVAFLPNFFDAFKKAFERLISELDQVKVEQLAESHRRMKVGGVDCTEVESAPKEDDDLALLAYHNRSTNPQHNLPRLKPLGEGTTDAARMLPMIKKGMAQIPIFSHRFVTLKLEELMSVMLKLYEKQLDVPMDEIDDPKNVEWAERVYIPVVETSRE